MFSDQTGLSIGNHLIRQSPVNFVINKLIMQETGTYNTMQSRPYVSYVDQASLDNIRDRIGDSPMQIKSSDLIGVANGIVAPSPVSHGDIGLINGWQQSRIRFILEVTVSYNTGGDRTYFFQGFTDHPGISRAGEPDPNMLFIINSMVAIARTTINTPTGVRVQEKIIDSAHILADNTWSGDNLAGSGSLLRPEDIFSSMQNNWIVGSKDLDIGNVYDHRSMVTSDAAFSKRSNNSSASYLGKILDGYNYGRINQDFAGTPNNTLEGARSTTREELTSQNPFIKFISNLKANGITNQFTFGDLEQIDSNVRRVSNYVAPTGNTISKLHRAGQTEYWGGSNRETLAATILANTVPAIMMELLLSGVSFRSTNNDIGGQMTTILAGGQSLTTANLAQHYEIFKRRLESEVLLDITFNNTETYSLEMKADIFGEVRISISLGNGPMIDYCAAGFADSLYTPVVSYQANAKVDLVNDLEVILEHSLNSAPRNTKSQVTTSSTIHRI